ncbi:MAG TPA: AMP-binding protein [Phycisphaerales bacterium]|nr:AMP-binding protein [Phycisphaerales bacterium]
MAGQTQFLAPALFTMSIHLPILRSLLARPLATRIVDDKRPYRGAELLIASAHAAAAIRPKCDAPRVGVMLPTSGAFPIAALAGWMLGKTVVPLNYLLKQEELQYVVEDAGLDTVVTARALLDHMGYAPRVAHAVMMDDIDFRGVPEPVWPIGASADDLGVLLYTSGTSGKPKGVMLTHGNIAANISQVLRWIDLGASDKMLGVLPQFHSFGLTVLTLLPLSAGVPVVYTARFVPSKIVRLIREHRPTMLVAIPSMYAALLHVKDATREDFASLRIVVSGGEPLPAAVFNGFRERFGVTINEGYGLTETAPVTNWCRPGEWRPHSVGKPLPDIDQRIVEPATGRTLPPGRDGEVQMRGPNIMRGYYRLPDETAKTFTSDGYFRTGDIGRHDVDGHLYITGRIKEMIIVGGENVFPREIEEVLNQHPAVGASGVIGVRDDIRGELPTAFVEFKEGASATEQELLSWCRGRLAGYKVPREVRVVEALPRSPTGKIMRRELSKMV